MNSQDYERRQDGSIVPAYIAKMLATPEALFARAAIRRDIAKQDAKVGDTWAYRRNTEVATHQENRARDMIERGEGR